MKQQLTQAYDSATVARNETAELQRLIEPVKDDFAEFDRLMNERMQGDSPLITSIAQHLLKSKGKRIRPALAFLLCRAAGEFGEHTVEATLAIELIHSATLLHDDVVDESTMRRNQETVNSRWTNLISVLMGDYLFAKAFKIMSGIGSTELMKAISSSTERVSVGELRQIEETGNYELSEKEYLRVIADKTASLFDVACQIGPILGSGDEERRARFSRFGESLGVSFQVADDLLDFEGDPRITGKEPGNDCVTGKVTLPLIYAFQHGDEFAAREIKELLKEGMKPEEFPRVLEFVRSTGAIEYTRNRADELHRGGFSEIGDLPESEYLHALKGIADYVIRRRS